MKQDQQSSVIDNQERTALTSIIVPKRYRTMSCADNRGTDIHHYKEKDDFLDDIIKGKLGFLDIYKFRLVLSMGGTLQLTPPPYTVESVPELFVSDDLITSKNVVHKQWLYNQ